MYPRILKDLSKVLLDSLNLVASKAVKLQEAEYINVFKG